MDFEIQVGIEHQIEKIVLAEDSASRYGSGLVEVFSTPAMIAFMEKACLTLVQPYLPPEYNTVGVMVNVEHLKATPIGMKVFCKSKLIKIEGRKLEFYVEAHDEEGLIGKGYHARFIIDTKKFMEKLNRK